MKRALIFACLGHSLLFSLDLSHLSDYTFLEEGKHVEVQSYYGHVGAADADEEGYSGQLRYRDFGASAYMGGFVDPKNALCLQTGYSRMSLDWDDNPFFDRKHFDDFVVSAAWLSHAIPRWRWVIDIGAHIDTKFWNLVDNTFYTGLLWGRLNYKPYMGFHYGLLGQTGVHSTYVLPIIGMDTFLSRRIQMNLVFPLDLSGSFYFTRQWKFSVRYRSFGGWYRANHQVGEDENDPGAFVTQSTGGVDGGIYFDSHYLDFAFFGGYNIGGWILEQNKTRTQKTYVHFNGAPYGGVKLHLAF